MRWERREAKPGNRLAWFFACFGARFLLGRLGLRLVVGLHFDVSGDGGDRAPVERDHDVGRDLEPYEPLLVVDLTDMPVEPSRGDDLVSEGDGVLHRRMGALAAAARKND